MSGTVKKPGFTPPANAPVKAVTANHSSEVSKIQDDIKRVSAWISHRLGFHPSHEAAKQSLEAAVGHLEQSKNPSAQAVASGAIRVAGTSPPYNQTTPGAAGTSVPGKGPTLAVN